jgi:hypothetical protein
MNSLLLVMSQREEVMEGLRIDDDDEWGMLLMKEQ